MKGKKKYFYCQEHSFLFFVYNPIPTLSMKHTLHEMLCEEAVRRQDPSAMARRKVSSINNVLQYVIRRQRALMRLLPESVR